MHLAKQAAMDIIRNVGYRLSLQEKQDLYADCYLNLVETAGCQKQSDLPKETVDAYFKKGKKWFTRHKTNSLNTALKNKLNMVSITKLDGRDREILGRPTWFGGDVLEYTGCPHAEYVRRIIIDGEDVTQVFDSKYEVKLWYTKMLPEIRAHLRELYDLGEVE